MSGPVIGLLLPGKKFHRTAHNQCITKELEKVKSSPGIGLSPENNLRMEN